MKRSWVEIVLVWGSLALVLSLAAAIMGDSTRVGGDNAMRLVGATDLFHGQSWFDTDQHRDNTPFGASMHFSRLVDAPLVLLMALFTPLAGAEAPVWAGFVWPLLVLFVLVVLVGRLAETVAGPSARLPALALLAMTMPVYTEFIPGRVDHHNVQIVLTLGMILLSIAGRTHTASAIGAAALAAAGIAIGTESLPSVAAVLVAFGLFWVVDPQQSRASLLAVAAAFPTTLLVLLLGTTAPAAWLTPACDALSLTYLAAGLLYGFAVLGALATGSWATTPLRRLGVLAGAALLAGVLLLVLFPECRRGPYGNLDPELAAILLPQIGEAQSAWVWAAQLRPQVVLLLAPLAGMVALVWAIWRSPPERRDRWLVLGGFCLLLFVVAVLQVRGVRLLCIALLPAGAHVVAVAWARLHRRQTLGAAALASLAILTFSGVAHLAIAGAVAASIPPAWMPQAVPTSSAADWETCRTRDAFAPLAELPPSRVIAYLIIGPHILFMTPHSVVSAGYHRNEQGLKDMVRFFGGGETEARAVVEERGLDYLVFCRDIPPALGLEGVPAFTGLDWDWLTPVSPPDAPVQIYAIAR